MNASRFRLNVGIVMALYLVAALLGIGLAVTYPPRRDILTAYGVWKDLLPLIVAIPAAWLGYCFQRRQTYLKDVGELWSKIVPAVQSAIQYTHLTNPTAEAYSGMMKELATVIEEVRGVFSNIQEGDGSSGFFPFDSLKDIHNKVGALGYSEYDPDKSRETRAEILRLWKHNVRRALLFELPRGAPEFPDSLFIRRHRPSAGGQSNKALP